MASYTIELRRIIELYGEDEVKSWFSSYNINDYLTEEQAEAVKNLKIFNPEKLAEKIINHYYMREIGFETPYLFRHFAMTKMNEIMEEKAWLYYSLTLKYNPFGNYNSIETFKKTKENISKNTGNESLNDNLSKSNNGSSSSNSSASGTSLNFNSDTPQGNINKADILTGHYATTTSANETSNSVNDSTTNQNSETATQSSSRTNSMDSTSNDNENYEKLKEGNIGMSNNKMLEDFRKNIISIEKQIIDELNPLFMGLLM